MILESTLWKGHNNFMSMLYKDQTITCSANNAIPRTFYVKTNMTYLGIMKLYE